jgi:hypothetical protein
MNTEVVSIDEYTLTTSVRQATKPNPFMGAECVLKSCCKKYKKGKRCKKCPD